MIKAKAQVLLKKAFDNQLIDAVKTIYIHSINETNTNVPKYKTRGIVESYDMEKIIRSNGLILSHDRQLVLLQNEVAVVPKVGDRVSIDKQDAEYGIKDVSEDPTGTVWLLHVRG